MATGQTYDQLIEAQIASDKANGPGKSVAGPQEWAAAWKTKEKEQYLRGVPKEDHSDPTPLLMDKASALPPGSARRLSLEKLKHTLDNTTSNVGCGLDALTRELYKDVKRLVKHSDMLQRGAEEPLPSSHHLFGQEEGTVVSNLQSWKPSLSIAIRPVSDAIGSHADISASIVKHSTGPTQLMPTAANATVDCIHSHFTNEVDMSFKSIQLDALSQLPAKAAGSLRQLSTAGHAILSVPFELASDVYGGLMGVIGEVSGLLDHVMNSITSFVISSVGGLIDGLFPIGQLKGILGPIKSIASKLGSLGQLLNGFSALSGIVGVIGGILSNVLSILGDITKIAGLFKSGANVASIVGGSAGQSLGCIGEQIGMTASIASGSPVKKSSSKSIRGILDGLNDLQGLGNIGLMLGGGINLKIGSLTANIRDFEQILLGLLPLEISIAMKKLDKLCGLGTVGNLGFSAGNIFDFLRDNAFSVCMLELAAHSAIVGPLFNKDVRPVGSYSQEASLDMFIDSPFVKGAQGNKGVTMIGPGGTAGQKVFGVM